MDKVKTSRRLNRLLGGDNELYCSRVYRLSKIDPYGWKETMIVIDLIFLAIRKEKQHVRKAYLWERRYNATQKTSEQSTDKKEKDEA